MANIVGDDNPNVLFSSLEDDFIFGAGGNDTIHVHESSGIDTIDGGSGFDFLVVASSGTVLVALGDRSILVNTFSFFASPARGQLTSIEGAAGGAGNDLLWGSSDDNILQGLGGDDRLDGALGADVLDGGQGNDTAAYHFAAGPVSVFLAAAHMNGGEAAGDTFLSIENLEGSGFGDLLSGDASNNELYGLDGGDFLAGGGGDDALIGDVTGHPEGSGDDTLVGGLGWDTMMGGTGATGRAMSLLSRS